MEKEKKVQKNQKFKERGITLIALIITIIVLLILAGVALAALTGDSGILNNAESAKYNTYNSYILEQVGIAWQDCLIDSKKDTSKSKEEVFSVQNIGEKLEELGNVTSVSINDNDTGEVVIKDEDNNSIIVEILEGGAIKFKEIDVWNGTDVDTSWYNDTDNEFRIDTAAKLAGLAQLVNSGNYFMGKTIYLEKNIDLNNKNWSTIGNISYFCGNFYGNNKTIYNLKNSNIGFGGLFGYLSNAKIKDLKIENINITNSDYCGGIAGYAVGTSVIENIELKGKVVITGQYYVAGIVGYITGTPTVKNITIDVEEGSYVEGTSSEYINNAGGVVGVCTGTFTEPNINFATIENCYSNIDVKIAGAGAGGIAGFVDAANISNCTSEARISLIAIASDEEYLTIGGISGYTCHSGDVNNVTINNCKFNGELEYSVNGQVDSNVVFCNSGIAGFDRIYASQNLKINKCYFNGTEVNK